MKCYPIGPSWDTGGTPITAVDTVARAIVHLSLYRSPQSCGSGKYMYIYVQILYTYY